MVLTPEQRQLIEQCAQDAASHEALLALFETQDDQHQSELETYDQLNRLNWAMVEATNLEALLRAFAEPVLSKSQCAVLLHTVELNAAGQPEWIELAAHVENTDAMRPMPVGTRLNVQDYSLGRMFADHPHEVISVKNCADVTLDAAERKLLERIGVVGITIMPLYLPVRDWIGILTLIWPTPYELTAQEIRLFELLRAQMTPLIENFRLFDQARRQAAYKSQLLMNVPIGLATLNASGAVIEANDTLARLTGYSETELLRMAAHDLLPDVKWSRLNGATHQFDLNIRRRDGEPFQAQVNITGFDAVDGGGWLVSVTDISNLRRAESELRDSEVRYQVAIQADEFLVCRYSADMILLYANEAYARLFKRTPDEIVGRSILNFVSLEAQAYIKGMIANPKPNMHEVRVARDDGSVVWQQWSDQPIYDEAGNLEEIQAIGRDITLLKQHQFTLHDHLVRTRALYHTARALIDATDLDECLQIVVDGITDVFSAHRVVLIVPHSDKEEIAQLVTGGPGTADVTDFPYYKLSEGLVGWVWRERRPALSPSGQPDEREQESNHQWRRANQIGSVMVAPLRYGETMLGVVAVSNRMGQADYTESDLDLLMAQAHQTSSAIQNARLLDSLQNSESQYRAVVEQQSELISRLRPDLIYTFVNDAYCRTFGKSADEIIGKSLFTISLRDRYDDVKKDFAEFIKNPRRVFHEHTIKRHDGAVRWIQWVREPIFNDQGELIEIQSVGRDITDLKAAQDALSRSEERYRRFIEAAPVGVMITRETIVQYANLALVRLLKGQSADEIQGRTVFDILHPDYHDLMHERVERLGHDNEESSQRLERFICLDGSEIDVEIAITSIEMDGAQVSLTFVRDISRRKASEDALHLFQTRLKALQKLSIHLGSMTSFDDFCREAVERGREELGVDRMGLWFMVDGYTVGSFGTDEDGKTIDERSYRYRIDEDFPGYHFNETNFLTFKDNTMLKGRSGALNRMGWHALTALWDGNQVIGVLAADNLINQQPASTEQVELLVLYGSTLGHLATRLRTQEALRQGEEAERKFQQQLRALHEVSIELTKTRTLQEFCRQAVEQGRERLGFDRFSMWFVDDDDPEYLHGSFGIDEQGELREEWENRIYIPDTVGSDTYRVLTGELHEAIDRNIEHRDGEHQKLGTVGWVAVAGLRDGDRIIGCVYVDNFFGQQPLGRYQLELLRLYGITLGHLATLRRTQDALLQSEARYRAIYEGAGVGICVVNSQGRPVAFNPLFVSMLGYEPGELRQMHFSEFTHPDHHEENFGYFKALNAGEIDHYQMVKRYIDRNHKTIWVNLNVSRFPGRIEGDSLAIAMVADITAQKEAELHYQESETRRLALLEALPDLIFMLNREGVFLDYHAPDDDKLLLAPEVFLNKHYRDVLPDDMVKSMHIRFDAVLTTGEPQVYEYPVIYDDQTEYFESRMIAYGDQHILAVVRNITDSRRAEAQLRESEERFRQIAENVDEVFYVQDVVDNAMLYINPAYEHIWEQSRSELLSDPKALANAIHPDDREHVLAEMVKTHDRRFDLEYRIQRADNELRWMWARNFPIRNEQGETYRLAGVIKDITERKQVEAKNLEVALHQERVKILSDFIRDASHEFRTPLSIINSKVYLAGRVQDPEARQAQLQGIQDQSNHILKLVESLVTMTRLDSQLQFEMHPMGVNSLLQAIHARHQPMVADRGIDFCIEVESDLAQISGDVDELYAAIVHLIENAVAHTPAGGTITLRTGRLDENRVTLAVEDTGSGIAEDLLSRIFDKFYRGDEAHSTPGFGLGLPIAQKIVEGHSGEIKVESRVGEGSTFTIILPV